MAVIKVFDSKGVKTIKIMGNVMEQPYDCEEALTEEEDSSVEEEE